MKVRALSIILLFSLFFIVSCDTPERISLWERHCEACHDGKTILNEDIMIDKEKMQEKYPTMEEFKQACAGAPPCMNVVKHNEKLFITVGKELGINKTPQK